MSSERGSSVSSRFSWLVSRSLVRYGVSESPGRSGMSGEDPVGMSGIVDETGRLDQVLGGQAAPVDTSAAEGAPLGHHRRFAQVLGMNGGSEGRRATAQNQ